MRPGHLGTCAQRAVIGFLGSLALITAFSPVYRDFFADRRDIYQGASFANFAGHLEYDRRVVRDFSWGAWFWNPDKAMGIPRFGEVLNRPLYPVHLIAVALLPTISAWHWINVLHVSLKLAGLVLLGVELGWPAWLVVLSSSGAMLTFGALSHFGDVIDLTAAAWLPLQLWLTVKVTRSPGWTRWDVLWIACAALRLLGSNPNRALYYEILIVLVIGTFGWRALRPQIARIVVRYALASLLIAPLLLPALMHFADSARAHFLEFDDWHFRRAYNWRNYWLRLSDLTGTVLVPYGVWAALGGALALTRGRTGPLSLALAGYALFAFLHNIRYAPFWFLLALLPGVRIPQKAFEPLTWLTLLALAETAARFLRTRRDVLLEGCMIALVSIAFASAVWGSPPDLGATYVAPRWTRQLPRGLAAIITSEPRGQVLLATGTERVPDERQPELNSNHNFFLGLPSARFFGDVPTYAFMRATYRIPGLLMIQRMPTPAREWEAVVDLYAELGIRWVIWDGEEEPVHPRLRFVAEEDGFRLYEIRGARPLAYALPSFRTVERPSVPSLVADLVYTIPSLGPFCYGCPYEALAGLSRPDVSWEWKPGVVRVKAASQSGTWVVLGETFSPGWSATVDGTPTRIYQVNEMFQTVWVRPGCHEVVWQFTEPSFFFGLGLSGVGMVLVGAVHLMWRRESR